MSITFKDTQLQKEFEREGFVIVDFLDEGLTNSLLRCYEDLAIKTKKRSNSPTNSHETEISIFNEDKEFTKAVHQEIVDTFKNRTDEILADYMPIMGNMVYKNPNEKKEFSLHQDWRFSDEKQYTSINIWCPLVDTNLENGTLHLVKKSHLFQNETIRGANIGDSSNKISDFIMDHFGSCVNLKAGQAVILNTQMYHFSPPNISNKPRPVALLAMLPKKANMYFYYKNPSEETNLNAIEKYEINADFMTNFCLDEAPKEANKIDTVEYTIEYFTEKSFIDLYEKHNNKLPLSLYYSEEGKRMVFRDTKLQKQFEKEGYVKINLLDEIEIKVLREKYEALSHSLKGELQLISIYDKNKEFTTSVHKEVSSLFEKKLENKLANYKSIIGYFVYKRPKETEDSEMHQDASFSDEKIFTTINIWCPLVDSDTENGTLHIIKRSHLFTPSIRGFRIGYAADRIRPFIKKYFSTKIPMQAGQAIIMNTQLYHFSPPNKTKNSRSAAVLAMLPKEAPLYMYYSYPLIDNEEEKIECFEIEDDFLVKQFNIDEIPRNQKSLGMVDYKIPYFTKESFINLYKEYNKVVPLKSRINYFLSNTFNRF
jgi:ectoine hydroxylase-related dioxygenase (phytanoyl-CoA dioxygenase family)